MSRHVFRGADAIGPVTVSIGWDRPLRTFFIRVHREAEGEEEEVMWRGGAPGEIAEAAQLVALAAPFASLPADVVDILDADRARECEPDGPAQIAARAFLFGRR